MILFLACVGMFNIYVACMCMYRTYTGGYTIRTSINLEPDTRDKLKGYLAKTDTYDTGIPKMIDHIHDLERENSELEAALAVCRKKKKK